MVVLTCATGTASAPWASRAGTANARPVGGVLAAAWPWRRPVLTTRTTKEVHMEIELLKRKACQEYLLTFRNSEENQFRLFLSCPLDGLTDCMDPDCCIQSPCQNSPLCRGSRDPLQVIQQSSLSQHRVRSFYDRVKMLVGRESTHVLPGENPFNSR